MKSTLTKNIATYLRANHTDLQSVLQKCQELDKLNQNFLPLLAEPLRKSCSVANTKGTTLILIAANGSIATQIRFSAPDLLRLCRTNPALKHFQTIECKVRPTTINQRQSNKTRQPMSPLTTETAELIQATAESITDPRLKEVMLKIARRIED